MVVAAGSCSSFCFPANLYICKERTSAENFIHYFKTFKGVAHNFRMK